MAEVSNIQRLCTHDGPGIRTTVFLTGCPLQCWWCHNPENRQHRPADQGHRIFYTPGKCVGCGGCQAVCPRGCHQITETDHLYNRERCIGCGRCAEACPTKALEATARTLSVEEILSIIQKDLPFYGEKGGLTLSGGEPTYQAEACFAILEGARALGISTDLETCGYFPASYCERLVGCVSLFLYDIKDTDPERHLQNTGAPLKPILENLRRIDALGGETVLRCILIHGVNDTEEHGRQLAALFRSLQHCRMIEVLPYHSIGASKWSRLGLSSRDDEKYIPSAQVIADFKQQLREAGAIVKD